MADAKRIRQFKILAGCMLGALLLILGFQIAHFFQAVRPAGYNMNKEINAANDKYAAANLFHFTDKTRDVKKARGIYRIAVIGDSFIYGDGLPYNKVWSHKLESQLQARYDSIEVLSWGRCGWSTLDEFNFYKQHGKDYDIDLLIIGWVDNDPDVGKIKQVYAGDAQKEHPFIYFISPAAAQSLLNKSNSNTVGDWMEQIYGEKNLKDYQQVLNDFKQYLTKNKVPAIVFMTPASFDDYTQGHHVAALPYIKKSGFDCVDLFPIVQKKLGRYTGLELQANPVNFHPGDLMNTEFANEVQAYLEEHGYLKQLHKKE